MAIPTDGVIRTVCVAAAAFAAAFGSSAHGQSIAERVGGASGDVEIRFAARPGVCGDGEGSFSFRSRRSTTDHSDWWQRCEEGPVRVRLTVRDGTVRAIHTLVGGRHRAIEGLSDLGAVGDRDAVRYFLSLARTADEAVAREAIVPVALADSVSVGSDLLALADSRARPTDVRRNALFWAGQVAGNDARTAVERIARDSTDDRRMREQAVFVLSQLPDDGGEPALAGIARSNEAWLASKAAFWLGQSDDPRARDELHRLVTDRGVADDVRGQAVFVLGQHDSPDDQAFLRREFDSLGTRRLQNRVLMGAAQHGGPDATAWLLALAGDSARPLEVRKEALFWAGQDAAVRTSELAGLYDRLAGNAMRRQLVFVLSQRDDSASTDALMRIARSDPDSDMRKQAMFWLGQKHDPRVMQFLTDILEH